VKRLQRAAPLRFNPPRQVTLRCLAPLANVVIAQFFLVRVAKPPARPSELRALLMKPSRF